MRICCLLVLMVTACASRAPSQTLKSENKRLRNELAEARSQQAELEEKLKAQQVQLAQLDQAAKAKDIELAKLRTETSTSWRELAEARGKAADKADKRVPTVQCPQGTMLDPTATSCVPVPPPPPPPVVPPPPPPPVTARIIKLTIEGDYVVCVLGAGTENGVAKTWRAQFLRGTSTTPLPGGKAEIVRVDRRTTTIRVQMTTDAISANPSVLLSPGP